MPSYETNEYKESKENEIKVLQDQVKKQEKSIQTLTEENEKLKKELQALKEEKKRKQEQLQSVITTLVDINKENELNENNYVFNYKL